MTVTPGINAPVASRTTPETVAVDPCEKMKLLPIATNPIAFAVDRTNLHHTIPFTIHRSFKMRTVIAGSRSETRHHPPRDGEKQPEKKSVPISAMSRDE